MFDLAFWAAITPQFTLASFGVIAPVVILLLTAILLLFLVVAKAERDLQLFVVFAGLGVAAFWLWASNGGRFPHIDAVTAAKEAVPYLEVDDFTAFFHMIFIVMAAIVCLLSLRYLALYEKYTGEFFVMVLFATIGMMVMTAARDLLTMYLALELMSIATYVLVGYLLPERRSQEAALKYFFAGAFGSAIFLFGMAFLYGATGSFAYEPIGRAAAVAVMGSSQATAGYFTVGAVFVIVGFSFKIAAVPFHMWAPDAYDGAPTPITLMMAVAVKAAAFAVFARILFVSLDLGGYNFVGLVLATLCALTMIWGNAAALAQRNLKRLLAYSSIAHAGYMMMALVAREEVVRSLSALRFYFLIYLITTVGAFTVLLTFERKGRKSLEIEDYAGIAKRFPISAAVLLICLLSLAGIPPTAGFLGKWHVFSAAIKTGHISLAILGVLTSLISVYYYLRVVYVMYMLPLKEEGATAGDLAPYPYEQRLSLSLALLVVIVGLFPDSLSALSQRGILAPTARIGAIRLRKKKEAIAAEEAKKRQQKTLQQHPQTRPHHQKTRYPRPKRPIHRHHKHHAHHKHHHPHPVPHKPPTPPHRRPIPTPKRLASPTSRQTTQPTSLQLRILLPTSQPTSTPLSRPTSQSTK